MKNEPKYHNNNSKEYEKEEVGHINNYLSSNDNDVENSKKRPFIEVSATGAESEENEGSIIKRADDDDGYDDDRKPPFVAGEVVQAKELRSSALVENSIHWEEDDDIDDDDVDDDDIDNNGNDDDHDDEEEDDDEEDDNDDGSDNDVDDDVDDDDYDYNEYNKREFLEYCNMLRCNNNENNNCPPQSVFISASKVPRGCLQQIGDALVLQNNTHIRELILNVGIMKHEKRMQCALSLIEFVRTSRSLHKVTMHSHGMEDRQSSPNAERLANLIYRAITDNEHIQELAITGPYSSDAFDMLMSTSSSLKAFHLECQYDLVDVDLRHRFLCALERNHSVLDLSLCIIADSWSWLEDVPLRIGNGPSTLQSLDLAECITASPHFFKMLSTTSSLRTLKISCCIWDDLTLGQLQRVFAMNASIVHVCLEEYDTDSRITVDKILRFLRGGPSTLRKLTLVSKEDDFGALEQYLCTCTAATRLHHLEFNDCDMDTRSMNHLVRCFRLLDSYSTTTLTELTLKSCHLTKKALCQLVKYFTARSTRRCYHGNDRRETVLPELDYVSTMYPAPELDDSPGSSRFEGVNRQNVMEVSMSTTACGVALLSMYPLGNVPAFCDVLTETATSSPLACLQLSNIEHVDSVKLAHCLSLMISLRALHLVDIQNDVTQAVILNGLQKNGSLFTATFIMKKKRPFFQHERHKTLIQSYFQRNRFLSEIMLKKSSVLSCSQTVNPTNTAKEDDVDIIDDRLAIAPTLFRVANAILLTRPRFITAVLLALGSGIGPRKIVV